MRLRTVGELMAVLGTAAFVGCRWLMPASFEALGGWTLAFAYAVFYAVLLRFRLRLAEYKHKDYDSIIGRAAWGFQQIHNGVPVRQAATPFEESCETFVRTWEG